MIKKKINLRPSSVVRGLKQDPTGANGAFFSSGNNPITMPKKGSSRGDRMFSTSKSSQNPGVSHKGGYGNNTPKKKNVPTFSKGGGMNYGTSNPNETKRASKGPYSFGAGLSLNVNALKKLIKK